MVRREDRRKGNLRQASERYSGEANDHAGGYMVEAGNLPLWGRAGKVRKVSLSGPRKLQ